MSAPPQPAAVLLVGPEAEALAPRLELSGHRPVPEAGAEDWIVPMAVVLSPGGEGRIPELRRRYGVVPVLLGLTADTVEGRSLCLASGADDFWLTALAASDLLMRLRLHMGGRSRSGHLPPAMLQVADLQVWPGQRRVRRGERPVDLTSREFDLLLLLLRHPGEVLSRERILSAVWAELGDGASNVIEVYVRYLRQKLEAGGERRLIHTVRGRGYCLAERLPLREGAP